MTYFATAFAIAWLVTNAVATRTILCAEHYTREQRLLQLLFVWLVPFLGAFLIIAYARRGHYEAPSELPDFDDSDDVDVSRHDDVDVSRHDDR
jgi:hypothetical protein